MKGRHSKWLSEREREKENETGSEKEAESWESRVVIAVHHTQIILIQNLLNASDEQSIMFMNYYDYYF